MTSRLMGCIGPLALAALLALSALLAMPAADGSAWAQERDLPGEPEPDEAVLFERLGGEEAVRRVSRDLVERLQADPEIALHLPGAVQQDPARLRDLVAEELCALANGPCRSPLPEMKELHFRHGVTLADWDRGMDHLAESLRAANTPRLAREALLTEVANRRAQLAREIGVAEGARRVAEDIGRILEDAPPDR